MPETTTPTPAVKAGLMSTEAYIAPILAFVADRFDLATWQGAVAFVGLCSVGAVYIWSRTRLKAAAE